MTKAPMVKGISLEIPVLAFQVRVLVGAPMNKCVSKGAIPLLFYLVFGLKPAQQKEQGRKAPVSFPLPVFTI